MPSREVLDMVPTIISPLKGRKTIRRNSTNGYFNQNVSATEQKLAITVDIDIAIAVAEEPV
jgi:hypothetical protein